MIRIHRRRPRSRGQSMVELAIAAPFLLVLLVGAAQFAYLAYAGITVQTAAREGARIASENPNALSPVPSCPGTAPASGSSTGNSVCDAIYRGAGLLSSSPLAISVTAPDTSVSIVPGDVVRVDNPHTTSSTTTAGGCNGTTVSVNGSVSPAQTATITDNGSNTINKTTLSDGTFTLCLSIPNGNQSYTDTVYFTAESCPSTQVTQDITVTRNGASPSSLSITLSPVSCGSSTSTTSTSTSASSSTSTTSSASSSSSSASSFTSSSGTFTCSSSLTGQYVTVTVSYQAPVFVPGLSWLLGSTRTMTATVTMRVESCNVQGTGS